MFKKCEGKELYWKGISISCRVPVILKKGFLIRFLCILLGFIWTGPLWALTFKSGDLYYRILSEGDKTVEVTFFQHGDYSGDVVIPSAVTYQSEIYTVTGIGIQAFWYCSSLTSLYIPESVNAISFDVFSGCNRLENIVVDGLNPYYSSFDGVVYSKNGDVLILCPAAKKKVGIPNSVVTIGDGAFGDCSLLTSIEIPDGVTTIGHSAFQRCASLSSIDIPKGVTTIGYGAFSGCASLTSIDIPSGVTSLESSLFSYCSSLTSVDIPYGVTTIDNGVFQNCSSLTSINIPGSATTIGDMAFANCSSLTSIDIPASVTAVGSNAFSGCSSLISANIAGITKISSQMFYGCWKLASVVIPSGVTEIGTNAFFDCHSLEFVRIPDGVTTIEYGAFSACSSLDSINIPNTLTTIGDAAFMNCQQLVNVYIPSSVISIGRGVFTDCNSLENIVVDNANPSYFSLDGVLYSKAPKTLMCWPPAKKLIHWPPFDDVDSPVLNGLQAVGYMAFCGNQSLVSVKIPEGVETIEYCAFYGCTSLVSVDISSTVRMIEESAFEECDTIRTIYCRMLTPIECNPGFSDNVLMYATLYVPTGTKAAYEKVDPWRNFWNIEEMDFTGIESISADKGGSVEVRTESGGVSLSGAGGETVRVYDLNGRMVLEIPAYGGQVIDLPAGNYVLSIGDQSLKVRI